MGYMSAELFYKTACILGEGPAWDHRNNELLWVDIDSHTLYFLKEGDTTPESHVFDQKIGFAAPAGNSKYIIGLQNGLHIFERKDRTINLICNPEPELVANRWNDGKCGPDGNVWAGTMSTEDKHDQGGLYRLDSNLRVRKMLHNVGVSNGLAWNADLGTMYYIDSPTRSIQCFEYKKGEETISGPYKIIKVPKGLGFPDGMTIDVDGMLWVAHWDGGCIARWHPETGQLITTIKIPAPRVTSCTFGGKNLSQLFVTTARVGLSKEQLEKYPLSGSLFVIDTNTKGKELTVFK